MNTKVQPTPEAIAQMTYPMEALGNVSVGTRQYAAGDIFDAGDIDNVNFLKVARAATSLSGTIVADPATEASGVVKTSDVQVAGGNPRNQEAAQVAKGTSNVESGNAVGRGSHASPGKRPAR